MAIMGLYINKKDTNNINTVNFDKILNAYYILDDINFLLKKYKYKNIFDMKININLLKSRYDDLETSLVKKLLQYLLPEKVRHKILNNLIEKYLSKGLNVGAYSIKDYWMGIENIENLKKVGTRLNNKSI